MINLSPKAEAKIALVEHVINSTNGLFFSAKNVKKTGEVREYKQVRTGVHKFVKGTGQSLDKDRNPTLYTLWENTGKAEPTYKAFDMLTCIELTFKGTTYTFESLPEETIKKMEKLGQDVQAFKAL